jgi:hypothetical protein
MVVKRVGWMTSETIRERTSPDYIDRPDRAADGSLDGAAESLKPNFMRKDKSGYNRHILGTAKAQVGVRGKEDSGLKEAVKVAIMHVWCERDCSHSHVHVHVHVHIRLAQNVRSFF